MEKPYREKQYRVIQEIKNISANLDDIPVLIDIPVGTICTEENYGRGQTIYVYCTIREKVYHDIAFPPFFLKPYVEPYVEQKTIPNGGRRKKKTKTKKRTTTKRHHKTRRSY